MNALRVRSPGLLATVQDLGRPGHAALGVPPCGAMDPLSLRAGNRLVGNGDHAAAVECTLTGFEFETLADVAIAVTGDASGITVEAHGAARSIAPWAPHAIPAGVAVKVGRTEAGCRAYLCIAGGLDTTVSLASRATHITAGLGAAPLKAGDVLRIGNGARTPPGATHDAAAALRAMVVPGVLRVIDLGVHSGLFSRDFSVSSRSDRAGVRLREAIADGGGTTLVSRGMFWGAVQVPPDGSPVILGPDGPTTGGYELAAAVIEADLPRLGQSRPFAPIRFVAVTREQARDALREQRALLDRVAPEARRGKD
ncbi:MAG TPA: biotin-dependent carboxyltransferase family protein [Phycisphaerales bacterium]|nr:biotin-dependent carboxyltransferase family protein [Phycisphaerales bacterium]